MKNNLYILLALLALILCACQPDEPRNGEMEWGVSMAWQDGLAGQAPRRALPITDILADGTSDIVIDTEDYPTNIDITCMKGSDTIKSFTLTKGLSLCGEHPDYWSYTPSFLFRKNLIKREDYKFYASAVIDDDKDSLVCVANKDSIHGRHMFLTLHHTKALLRFAFKVDTRYDKVRYIKITNVNLNGVDITLKDNVLNKSNMQFIAYTYVDPTVITVSHENTILCTYDIYDKDADVALLSKPTAELTTTERTELASHLTREGVIARNQFTLNKVFSGSPAVKVDAIEAGYYYDLKVTLNPDYLYVMSEHDNKHLTID